MGWLSDELRAQRRGADGSAASSKVPTPARQRLAPGGGDQLFDEL
jgi:hypothetical protein